MSLQSHGETSMMLIHQVEIGKTIKATTSSLAHFIFKGVNLKVDLKHTGKGQLTRSLLFGLIDNNAGWHS